MKSNAPSSASLFEGSFSIRLLLVLLAAGYGALGAWILGLIGFWFWITGRSADNLWITSGGITGDELPFLLARSALFVCLVYGACRVLITPERSDKGHWMTIMSAPSMFVMLGMLTLPQLQLWGAFGMLMAGGYGALRWIDTQIAIARRREVAMRMALTFEKRA